MHGCGEHAEMQSVLLAHTECCTDAGSWLSNQGWLSSTSSDRRSREFTPACNTPCRHCPHHLPVSLYKSPAPHLSFFPSLFPFNRAGSFGVRACMTLSGTSSQPMHTHPEGRFTKETATSLKKLHMASTPRSTL